MKLVVDLTRCQGYAQCALLAPSAFRMRGDEALLYDPDPSDELRERVLRAAAACPVQAIVLDPVGSRNGARQADARRSGADDGFLRSGWIMIEASLAGLRAAAALRHEGFTGSLTLVGDEPHEPYDRPPLSKQVLGRWVPAVGTGLPRRVDVQAQWRLGVPAVQLDLAGQRVRLADGESVEFDRLLIATGVRARPWPNPAEAALKGVCVLRTREDADRLQRLLVARPARVLVIGSGFTGSEVASVCCKLGLAVTVAEAGPAPPVSALGAVIGAVAADMQRENGVDLRCGVMVSALEGDADGQLCRADLSDGRTIDVDVAVAALGGIRKVEWLTGSGPAAGRWGVACDAGCRAFDTNGLGGDMRPGLVRLGHPGRRRPLPGLRRKDGSAHRWASAGDRQARTSVLRSGADRHRQRATVWARLPSWTPNLTRPRRNSSGSWRTWPRWS